MFLGFYQLGDLLPLRCRTQNAAGTPLTPAAAPQARIIAEDGNTALTVSLPMHDQERLTGYFHHQVSLSGQFSSQRYTVIYSWLNGVTPMAITEEFEVILGGSASGAGIAMHFFRQEAADYVLYQDDTGELNKLRGPEVRNAT